MGRTLKDALPSAVQRKGSTDDETGQAGMWIEAQAPVF